MILNEDIFDSEVAKTGPVTMQDNGIANMLITEINGEWDTIKNYNDLVVTLSQYGYDDYIPVIEDIMSEENKHIGQLQNILERISPNVSEINWGQIEAQSQIQ